MHNRQDVDSARQDFVNDAVRVAFDLTNILPHPFADDRPRRGLRSDPLLSCKNLLNNDSRVMLGITSDILMNRDQVLLRLLGPGNLH